jgi:hypothetical protein
MFPGTVLPVSLVPRAELARGRAEQLVAVSDLKCFRAWRRIASCQKLLSRTALRGGAAPDPLTEAIRAALVAGALPCIGHTIFAGRSQGDHVCVCCGQAIQRGEVEYEPRPTPPGLYAHLRCFTAWRVESARLEGGRAGPGRAAAGT